MRLRPLETPEYNTPHAAIRRIRNVLEDHGYKVTRAQADELWSDYSQDAGMDYRQPAPLPESDADLWTYLEPHCSNSY